ncbi:MAG TPA: secondary thiamine-phosphate synthase enzyme YjbQ [Xanthobacteraceae bacterium]|nr:secondary thiamine-phosphate synthase enzyme YjbQ [Xanthobacteraceae bacterium]
MAGQLSAIVNVAPQLVTSATLTVETQGQGFTEITDVLAEFVKKSGAGDGTLFVYLRHTSASLTIQENADPDVRIDLLRALDQLAPIGGDWIHSVEGPDDMPAHVRAMLTGVSLHVPVVGGELGLGTWQGVYLIEHRRAPHRREVILQFIGSRR